jgi:hypothetical protein
MANNRLGIESVRREQSHTLTADESMSPVFRGFIEIWARKIENVEQRAIRSRGALEESNAPAR